MFRQNLIVGRRLSWAGILCAAMLAGCGEPARRSPSGWRGGLAVGQAAPPIVADGWLNGDLPDLSGKVVVVDAWAYWCVPCRKAAPELVKTYNKFKDQGVVFIGLTPEGEDGKDKSEAFLRATGITWPNGYGAEGTLDQLKTPGYPTFWIIGKDGKIAWNFDSEDDFEVGIEQALAAK